MVTSLSVPFFRVCAFLLLLIPASGEHYWQGGPCWHTNVWIVSVLFFSSPLFPSLSLSQWCVQKRKSSSSVHLMVSTSRKLPAIRASAIFHAMHARLVLITLHSMSVQGGGRGDQCALKGPCPHQKGSGILWPHTAPILCRKSNYWQCSLTLPALSVK